MKNFKQLFLLAAMLTFGFFNTSFAQDIFAQVVITHAGGEKVYNLDLNDITGFNPSGQCDGKTRYLNSASGNLPGTWPTWNWTDNLPAGTVVTDVEIHMSFGGSGTGASRDYYLNGTLEGNQNVPSPTGGACFIMETRTLSPANYVIGGANSFEYQIIPHTYFIYGNNPSVFPGPPLVPTMGEWALIIFGLMVASFGVVSVMRWQKERELQAAV